MRAVMRIWVGRWCTVYRAGRCIYMAYMATVISFSGVLECV